jgi:hypothetical protein
MSAHTVLEWRVKYLQTFPCAALHRLYKCMTKEPAARNNPLRKFKFIAEQDLYRLHLIRRAGKHAVLGRRNSRFWFENPGLSFLFHPSEDRIPNKTLISISSVVTRLCYKRWNSVVELTVFREDFCGFYSHCRQIRCVPSNCSMTPSPSPSLLVTDPQTPFGTVLAVILAHDYSMYGMLQCWCHYYSAICWRMGVLFVNISLKWDVPTVHRLRYQGKRWCVQTI